MSTTGGRWLSFGTLRALLVLTAIAQGGCRAEDARLILRDSESEGSEAVMYVWMVGDDTVARERVFRSGADVRGTVERRTGMVRYVADADLSGRISRLEMASPDFATMARVAGGRVFVSDEIADAAPRTEEAPADVSLWIDGSLGLLAEMFRAGRAEGEATRELPILTPPVVDTVFTLRLNWLEPDSVAVLLPVGEYRLHLDAAGRILGGIQLPGDTVLKRVEAVAGPSPRVSSPPGGSGGR